MSRKNKTLRAFLHQTRNPTIKQAWDAAWKHAQKIFHARSMRDMKKQVADLQAEVERLRARVDEWKRVAIAQAELQGEAEERAERLTEALDELHERCAQECERLASTPCNTPNGEVWALGALACADEIRAMAGERKYDDPMLPLYDAPQPATPSEAVNVLGMPEFDGLLDHIYEYGTGAEGVIEKANAFARAVIARYSPHQPREQQSAPDVSALIEALETMVEMVELGGLGKAYAMDIARAALAAYRQQSADTVIGGFKSIPDLPHGFNHCAYNRQTGEWLYINHANTWQLFQGPSHDSKQPELDALVGALERVMYCNEVGFLPESVQKAVSDSLAAYRKGAES